MAVLRTITGELDLEERIREGLNAAGALFMVCVHLLVPLTLMRNPEDFAEKARRTLANQSFKEDPTPRRMRNFVLDSITKKRRPVPGASIWDAAEEDDKDSCRGRSRAVAAQTLGEVFPEAVTISLTAQPAPKGTSRPKQSRTADWTAEPEGQDQPQQPSRRSKRPAPKPLTSMPVKASRKNHRAAVPSSSSSEESDEEESLPLASAKARKVSASCQGF